MSDFLLLLNNGNISAIPVLWSGFEQGTGPVFLEYVACDGTESSLLSCSHPGIGTTSCSHVEDVGVVCPEGKVIYWVGGGRFPSSFKLADATSTEWEGQWPREIEISDTSNLDHYKLFRTRCWLLLLTLPILAVAYTKLHF